MARGSEGTWRRREVRWGKDIYKRGWSGPFIRRDSATELGRDGLTTPDSPFGRASSQNKWELYMNVIRVNFQNTIHLYA